MRDITERKRADEVLRESEKRYRRIVETANEGIAVANAEGQVTFCNGKLAETLACSVDEMVGASMFDFLDEQGRAAAQAGMAQRRQDLTRGTTRYDFKLRRKDGTTLWAIVSTLPIFDAEGRYEGSLAMVSDITDRKRAEESLTQSVEKLHSVSVRLFPTRLFTPQ